MAWRKLYTQARERTGISPVIKDDYYKIMSEGLKLFVNADARLKEVLLIYLKPYAFNEYKSDQSYKWAAIIPATFIQWMSERRNKQIILSDLDIPNTSPDDVGLFAEEYSPSTFVQAHIRSALIKFFSFISSPTRGHIFKNPLSETTTDMPRTQRTIVFNNQALDEFYNVIMFGAPQYYTLFFKILLQTGLRIEHAYYLTCGVIEEGKPKEDALGRIFYRISILDHLTREKRKIREEIAKKFPPIYTYISAPLKDEIMKWCQDNKLGSDGYIVKDFVVLDAVSTFIERRRKSPKIAQRLKQKPSQYILHALRDTWASTMFGITKNIGDLIDYGGWKGAGVPLTIYRESMSSLDALEIAKTWEIYIPPDRKPDVELLQGLIRRGEAEPTPVPSTIGQTEIDKMMALISKLDDQLSKSDKKIAELEQAEKDRVERERLRK